jgi:hypothetical protein
MALLIVTTGAGLVTLHVRAYPQLSPIDELQHIDYLDKASHGHIVARGERVAEPAMREEACRGIDAPVPVPRCDARSLRPTQFQEAGYNTAYIHPPTYYAVSGVLARIGLLAPGLDDLVTAGRLTGGLWLIAGLALLNLALVDLGARRLARASLLVVLACSPAVLHASATINPDAMALLAGSALLLGVLRWEAGRWPAWVPAATAAAAILVKSTNVAAVGAAILYVVARHVQARRHAQRPPLDAAGVAPAVARVGQTADVLRVVGALIAAVAVASVAWVAVQAQIAEVPSAQIPMVQRFGVDHLAVGDAVGQLGASISPLRLPYIPEVLRSPSVVSAVGVVDTALVAGLLVTIGYAAAGARRRGLAFAALATMAAAGPLFVVINFVFVGTFVDIPPRYGLSAVPFALAAASVALERRPLLIATATYAGWLALITVGRLS